MDKLFSLTSVHPVGISFFYGKCHCRACACVRACSFNFFGIFIFLSFICSFLSFYRRRRCRHIAEREKKKRFWIYVCIACTGCLMSLCTEWNLQFHVRRREARILSNNNNNGGDTVSISQRGTEIPVALINKKLHAFYRKVWLYAPNEK